MGHRCCGKQKVKRGLWSPEEDEKLVRYITSHGHASWSAVPKLAGLQRCGKSCRLRWINYLRPDLKRGSFTAEEEQIIIDVHRILGNRWAQIAKHLPGRTDNEVKNFWNSCIKKKLISQGLDPRTHNLMPSHKRASASNNIKATGNNNALSKTKQPLDELQNETFSIITVNAQTARDSSAKINPPVHALSVATQPPLTPPPLPRQHLQPPSLVNDHFHDHSILTCHQTPVPCQYDNQTNHFDNSHDPSIFYPVPPGHTIPMNIGHPSSPPYDSSSINTEMLHLLDENHDYNMRGTNELATNEPFHATTSMQKQEQVKNAAVDGKIELASKDPTDVSFDSSNFDIDFAALFSSAMSSDFNPMDEFAWTF